MNGDIFIDQLNLFAYHDNYVRDRRNIFSTLGLKQDSNRIIIYLSIRLINTECTFILIAPNFLFVFIPFLKMGTLLPVHTTEYQL